MMPPLFHRTQIALYPAYLYRLRVQNKRAYYAAEARSCHTHMLDCCITTALYHHTPD